MSNRITEKLLFSPTNIPGCTLWLDAADPNTVVGSSPVTNWKDKSGKGYDLSSSGGTPQYVNYGPGMSIYLNNAYLAVPSIAGGVNLANYSFFIVSLSQTAVDNQTAFSSATPGYYNYGSPYDISFFIDAISANQRTRFYSGGQLVLNSIPTTTIAQPLNLMSYTGNSAGAFSSWVNGNTGATNTSSARASGTTSFSAGGNWTQSAWVTYANVVCNLYEVVVYTTVLTTPQRQQVEGYLTWKWGLQGSLPPTHPYKNLAPSFPFNTVATKWTMYKVPTPPFLPTSVPGLAAWFDGSDPAGTGTPPSNGASISTWVDKSGNAKNAVAGGAPTFAAASQNGLGTITFNGSSTYLYASGLRVPTNTHSLFAVHNPVGVNATTQGGDTGILRAQETVGYIVFPYAYNGSLYGYTTSYISGYFGFGFQNDTAGAWNLYETVVGSSAVIQYQYGTVVSSNSGLSITATTSDNFTVGSYSLNGGSQQQFYYGSMAEVLVFNVELSTLNRQKIEGYLAWKWGKQASLSPSHPYYSAAPTATIPYTSIPNTVSVKYFSPRSITGLQLWLDGADPNANGLLPANGDTVSTWVDKSGNARNATVAAGKIAGTYSTSNKAVYFTATNTGYATSYTANPSLETMFVVFNNPSPTAYNNMVIGGPQGARSLSGGYAGGGAGVGACSYLNNQITWSGMASMPAGTYTSGTTVIITGQVNGLTTSISQNGGTIYSNTTTYAFSNVSTYLGTDYYSPSFYYIGYEMEVIFYNSLLSLNQRQTVEGYLAWKWSLQGSLPSNHPFKNCLPPP